MSKFPKKFVKIWYRNRQTTISAPKFWSRLKINTLFVFALKFYTKNLCYEKSSKISKFLVQNHLKWLFWVQNFGQNSKLIRYSDSPRNSTQKTCVTKKVWKFQDFGFKINLKRLFWVQNFGRNSKLIRYSDSTADFTPIYQFSAFLDKFNGFWNFRVKISIFRVKKMKISKFWFLRWIRLAIWLRGCTGVFSELRLALRCIVFEKTDFL